MCVELDQQVSGEVLKGLSNLILSKDSKSNQCVLSSGSTYMAVGAQNDLGGQQTFARKMTWCIAFLCQYWDVFFCPNWGVLQKKKKKKVFTETGTLFCQWSAQISRLFAQINRPFAQIFDDFRRFEPNGGATAPPAPPPPTAMSTYV